MRCATPRRPRERCVSWCTTNQGRRCSRWRMTAPACRQMLLNGCSTGSTAPILDGAASMVAPAWGWPSSGTSWRVMAGVSGARTGGGGGPASAGSCRPDRRGLAQCSIRPEMHRQLSGARRCSPGRHVDMPTDVTDVVVIGAGAAGLAAARAVFDAGRSVRILEARDRIGGRIFSRRDRHLAVAVELGAEFVQGVVPRTLDLARTANAVVTEM